MFYEVLTLVLIFLGLLAVGVAAAVVVVRLLVPLARRTRATVVMYLLQRAGPFLPVWFGAAGAAIALSRDGLSVGWLRYVDAFIFSAALATGLFVLLRWIGDVLRHYSASSMRLPPIAGMIKRLIQIAVWSIGLVMILHAWHVQVTPLLTTLGIAGLATALALQDTLANFLAGFYILADRPIRVGDYVRVDPTTEGYVVEVGWRSARIRTLANNIVVIPNQKLSQSTITNFSLPDKRTALSLPVSVDYGSDVGRVEAALLDVATRAADEVDGMLPEPPPVVRLNPGFGAEALELSLVCQVREFADQYFVQSELRKRILQRFRDEGIPFAPPTRRVSLPE